MSQSQYSYRLRLEDGQSVIVAGLETANQIYPGADIEAAFVRGVDGRTVGTNLADALKEDRAAIRAAAKEAEPEPEPQPPTFAEMTVAQLREQAMAQKLDVPANALKADVIAALEQAEKQ